MDADADAAANPAPVHRSGRIIALLRSESATLELKPDAVNPALWSAYPALVTLTASTDNRSCVATPIKGIPLGHGRVTIKVTDAARCVLDYFALAITDDPAAEPEPEPPRPMGFRSPDPQADVIGPDPRA